MTEQTQQPASGSIRRFLDLSTGHLSQATRDWIDNPATGSMDWRLPTVYPHPDGYGWFVYVPMEGDEPMPADLSQVLAYARAQGCGHVLFDCDAEPVDGLPFYDDDTEESA